MLSGQRVTVAVAEVIGGQKRYAREKKMEGSRIVVRVLRKWRMVWISRQRSLVKGKEYEGNKVEKKRKRECVGTEDGKRWHVGDREPLPPGLRQVPVTARLRQLCWWELVLRDDAVREERGP